MVSLLSWKAHRYQEPFPILDQACGILPGWRGDKSRVDERRHSTGCKATSRVVQRKECAFSSSKLPALLCREFDTRVLWLKHPQFSRSALSPRPAHSLPQFLPGIAMDLLPAQKQSLPGISLREAGLFSS